MKITPHITLALLPLCSAPLFAEEPPPITTTATPGVQELVRDRAIKFPALAHIPADAQMWLAINFTNATVSMAILPFRRSWNWWTAWPLQEWVIRHNSSNTFPGF